MDVQYNGKTLQLTQEAHNDVPLNAPYQWMAYARDREGNGYIVTWNEYEGFNGEDAGDACDWDDYNVIEV